MNEFDTNAFVEGFVQGLEQLNHAFLKASYMASLSCIGWKKFLGHGKNNKNRWEGKPVYRSRAHIKALRNKNKKGVYEICQKTPEVVSTTKNFENRSKMPEGN